MHCYLIFSLKISNFLFIYKTKVFMVNTLCVIVVHIICRKLGGINKKTKMLCRNHSLLLST